jgi:hypothetical protein
LKSTEYRVENLPAPTLYWGKRPSGDKFDQKANVLSAKYPGSMQLDAEFTITEWELLPISGSLKRISGVGGDVSAATEVINKAVPGEEIAFMCLVKGPDGMTRRVPGIWKVP